MQQGSNSTSTLTDEQILDMEFASGGEAGNQSTGNRAAGNEPGVILSAAKDLTSDSRACRDDARDMALLDDATSVIADSAQTSAASDPARVATSDGNDPAWLKSLEAQPQGGREAAAEARAWRAAAADVASLDAAYFSADPNARGGLAARLYDSDPAAFRAMLAESARMLSQRDPQGLAELARELGATPQAAVPLIAASPRTLLNAINNSRNPLAVGNSNAQPIGDGAAQQQAAAPSPTPAANANDAQDAHNPTNRGAFPAEAYRSFEAATNEDVARRVHRAIDHTLSTTLPDGVAEGARRRIAEDIFQEVHASLAADRDLGRRLGETLRDWRFDAAARQQVSSLLAGRARAVLPEVARRVVAEWTSSVLASDRAKTARIDAAASRRDITGGRLPEPVPASSLRPRDIDYHRLSDEQIMEL